MNLLKFSLINWWSKVQRQQQQLPTEGRFGKRVKGIGGFSQDLLGGLGISLKVRN